MLYTYITAQIIQTYPTIYYLVPIFLIVFTYSNTFPIRFSNVSFFASF